MTTVGDGVRLWVAGLKNVASSHSPDDIHSPPDSRCSLSLGHMQSVRGESSNTRDYHSSRVFASNSVQQPADTK